MNRKYNIQLNLSPYANYYAVGGNTGFKEVLEEENPVEFNRQLETQKDNKFLDFMNNSGGGGWAAAIAPAATNAINAITDTEASTAERVATAMGIPALAKIWTADNTAGDANLKAMQSNIDTFAKQNLIQDASSTFGANNAVKLNNKFIAPVPMTGVKDLSWKDFRGNMFKKGAAATLQGAAAGSVGGPWGALGGAVTGLFGSLFGGIGARSRAKKAYAEYQNKMATLTSQANSMYKQALTNQTLSNMQALANGNMAQRINDMANIRAYGGNLFEGGGDLTDEQQMVLADIQADPRILFTPKYSQWRDYIRRTSPDYLDRLYASLPYEQQQDIYQNDREAWGALSNEAKGRYGAEGSRRTMNEAGKYTGATMGIVGMAPAMEAVAMFPMLENGLNVYFGYEGARNLPTAVTNAYDYAKKGDWSRAGLSAGEALLDGIFLKNGISTVKNTAKEVLPVVRDKVYDAIPALDPYTSPWATFGYHGDNILSRIWGSVARRFNYTPTPEIPEFHRRMRMSELEDFRFTEDGKFIMSSGRTGDGHDNIINFATSEPARGHQHHKSLSGIDDFIVNPKALKDQKFISIEPSDTFFETGEFAVDPKDVTFVSGNPELLEYARSKGMNTLSSPKLREYYEANYGEAVKKADSERKNDRFGLFAKEGNVISPYTVGKEIQRLTSKRGAPTLKDYERFEKETGLNSGTVPKSKETEEAYYKKVRGGKAEFNNVVYNAASPVEALYRDAKIGKEGAAEKYSEYIAKLKEKQDKYRRNEIVNNNTKAMGGYIDLSPNMINLWSNKQQIDQQKAMNQQFSLGLGNSSFVNKFETGGPVDPPKEFMDVYHPDWGEYTPEYADLNYDDFMNIYQYGYGDEGDSRKYTPEDYNRYKYRKYLNYPNKTTFQNSYLFQPTYEELDKKYDDSDLPIYQGKDGQYYLKSGIGYNNIGGTGADLAKWMESNYDEYSKRVTPSGDIRLGLTKEEYNKYVLNRNDGNKRIEASKYDPKKHTGYIPVQDYNEWYNDEINRVKHELKTRAFTNEFYAGPEVANYNARNANSAPYTPNEKALRARQRIQEAQEAARRAAATTPSSKSSKNTAEKKATTTVNKQNSSPLNNTTYQQMEDYYGQKQSPLLNAQYKNTWAEGGQMTSADVPENMQYYANGGTHEENPYGGIQVGVDQQGTPNLAEEGEFRWNDFVFSDRINVDANLLSSFNLAPATKHQNKKAAKGKLSYADMAKKYAKRNKELENDPITKNSMEAFMQRLANAQEYQKKAEQLEAQKQNELQDYKTALNKQNNNPMYGTMKYNGMGNAATQQGVNSGVDAGMGNPMSNADLSNVNRSGNEMMAAYGGNLFARGGKDDPNPYEWTLDNLNARQVLTPWNGNFIGPTLGDNTNLGITPNADNYSWGNIDANTPFYQNEGWGIDMKPIYMKVKNPNYNAPAVSTYATRDKNGKIMYDPNGKPFMSYPRTYEGMKSSDYPDTKVIGKTVNNYGFYLPNALPERNVTTLVTTPEVSGNLARLNGNNYIPIASNGISPIGVPQTDNTGTTNTQIIGNGDVSNKVIDKTTSNTNPDAAVPSDLSEPPLYSTAGKYAQFGKGIMPMVWDWANRTNVAYDPYQRDADRLEALANEGPALRTADTIGGYRAPNLMDVERLNNSARAEGLAQMQAILDAANGNRGYVGAHSAQNNYNTQMGIGDNYVKTHEANNTNRLQTDQFNHGINVANQNAINAMYQDNQRAEQTQHQAALSGTAQAAALRQRENLHADEVNTERMKNRATNQAAAVDNALNYFTTQAMENQELNTRNNDPTNPYWIDKYGRTHYTGDSGLTQAIRDAFGNDKYGRNGTFTGDRLTEWNNLTKKYKAKDLKEHPELWQHLVTQQREANKIDAEKAEQARTEELEALRGTYQSNLARLNALRDSGAIISDPSYNLYTGWADDDYSGNQGLLRTRNQALDQYITQIGNNYDRYLYEKQLAQNQAKALGGYLNAGQNNNNDYYSYTRI